MSISAKVDTHIISLTVFPTWKPNMLIFSGNSNMRPLKWPFFLISNVPLYKSLNNSETQGERVKKKSTCENYTQEETGIWNILVSLNFEKHSKKRKHQITFL